jgi:hypothetical protein
MTPEVEVVAHGRSGVVRYREGANTHQFDWEFGGGKVVVTIYVPSPAEWDARLPWAAGRRSEVLAALGREVCRQKCPHCRVDIADRWINLLQ